MKKTGGKAKLFFWAALALAALGGLILFAKEKTVPTAQLQVQVLDGQSEQPLSDCVVIVAETGESTQTDQSGKTPVMTVPCLADGSLDKVFPRLWGEVTLLVYREGYLPYALFHTQVNADALRDGPRIYLFKEDGTMEKEPFSVIEGPPRDWVNGLLERFAPSAPSA